MILIKDIDDVVTVAVSTDDMAEQPTKIRLTNLQSKQVDEFSVYDVRTNERTAIYKFYVIRETSPVWQPDITYLKLPDGMYTYRLGSEIGLFQIGVPKLEKTVYNGQNNTNDVYYNG